MSLVIDDVLVRHDPLVAAVPVVLDSPHSGTRYPDDFQFTCSFALLRQAEDTYVDELFAAAPEFGATFLCALFPRSYIDVNRAPEDIDPALLEGAWPGVLVPTDKSRLGMGLVRSLCKPGVPMYDGRLPVGLVMERLERYWRPYHEQLAIALDGLHQRFGSVWHINCHSMPTHPMGVPITDDHSEGADFVLGDRDGTTCEPEFTGLVADTLRAMGYSVKLNDPYKGVELVRRYSGPCRSRHSLQIEIARRLYMDEETLERGAEFERVRRDLSRLVHVVCDYAATRMAMQAAE